MRVTRLLPYVNNLSHVSNYASTANCPLPSRGMGKHRKARVRHGISINSTKHHCRVWKGVWPNCCVGTSMTSTLPNSTRGSPQTCATSGCKWGLAIYLHATEWHCGSCTSIRWVACQHHDRQHAQCPCLWPASSVASVQVVAAQGEGSVSRGLKWGPGGPAVHFPRATLLGHCHSQWALQGTTISRGGSWPCAAWKWDNYHSDSHHYAGTNPLSGWYHWTSLRHHHGHKPASPGNPGIAAVNFLCSIHPFFQCSTPRKEPPLTALEAPPLTEGTKDPLRQKETDSVLQPWWQTSQRPPWVATTGDTPSSPTPFPSYSNWLYHGHQRWWAYPFSLSTRPLLGSGQRTDWWAPPPTRENEHGARVVTCYQGHHGLLPQRNGAQCRTCNVLEWGPSHWGYKRGWGMPCNCCLHPTTNSQGKHAIAGVQSEGGRGLRLPSLHGGLWGGLMNLSTQNLGGPNVPPSTPDWLCATSHHSRNFGYCPAGSCIGQGTSTSSLHSNCITDASTTRGHQMLGQSSDLKQEEEETVEPDHTTEEHPHWKQKKGRPVVKALKEPCCEAFSKESAVEKVARWAYFKTH